MVFSEPGLAIYTGQPVEDEAEIDAALWKVAVEHNTARGSGGGGGSAGGGCVGVTLGSKGWR